MDDLRLVKVDETTIKYPTIQATEVEQLLEDADYIPVWTSVKVKVIAAVIYLAGMAFCCYSAVKNENPMTLAGACISVFILWKFLCNILECMDVLRAKHLGQIWNADDCRYRSGKKLIRGLTGITEFLEFLDELKTDGIKYDLYWSNYDSTLAVMYTDEEGTLCFDLCQTHLFEVEYEEESEEMSEDTLDVVGVNAQEAEKCFEELKEELSEGIKENKARKNRYYNS